MSRLRRSRRQAGFTLLETLLTVALAGLVMLPLFGWAFVASQQGAAAVVRNTDGASVGLLRSYFLRDAASANSAEAGAAANGDDCSGGGSEAADPEDTMLRFSDASAEFIIYNRAVSQDGRGTSIWRRECDGGTVTAETELVSNIDGDSLSVGCQPRAAMPSTDCGRISLTVQTRAGQALSMAASLRSGSSVGSVGGGGPTYVSPDVVVSVSDVEVYRGETVTFDGSGSTDPTGGTLTYAWELGDGATSTDAVTTHAYTSLGEFTAVFTATNSDGTPASNYVRVRVVNRTPTAVISSPTDGESTHQCTNVSFAASGSHDDGDASYGGSIARYHWSYGDGATHTATSPGAHSHQYDRPSPGNGDSAFSVGLVVEDNDAGNSAQVTRDVYVVNRRPNVPPITAQVQGGPLLQAGATHLGSTPLTVTFHANATDPDGSCDTLTYEWDLGGGQSSSQSSFTHTFTGGSSKTVRLTVSDEHGGTRQSENITFTLNTPPVAAFTLSPTTVRTGAAVTMTNQSTDAETDASALGYSWSFPNGSPATSSARHPSTVFTHNVGAADTFISATYNVSLTVTDASSATHQLSRAITVTGAPAPGNFRKTGGGCQRSNFFGCQERYIDFAWNPVGSVAATDSYQLHVRCTTTLCGDEHTRTFTSTSTRFAGLSQGFLGATLTYDTRIRARDAYTGKWGPWSPTISANSQ